MVSVLMYHGFQVILAVLSHFHFIKKDSVSTASHTSQSGRLSLDQVPYFDCYHLYLKSFQRHLDSTREYFFRSPSVSSASCLSMPVSNRPVDELVGHEKRRGMCAAQID